MVTQSSRWHSAHRSLEQQSPGRTGPNIIFWLPQRDLEESFGFEIQDVAEFAFGKRPKKPKPKRLLPNPPGCTFSSAFSTFALNPKPIILGNQQPPSLQFFNIYNLILLEPKPFPWRICQSEAPHANHPNLGLLPRFAWLGRASSSFGSARANHGRESTSQLRWGTENHAQLSLTSLKIWMFPKIEVPQNRWFIMEKPY